MNLSTSDTEPLYSGLGGDPDFGRIVEMFVEEMPDRVATLSNQLGACDWDALRRTAHQIKGAAGSYGFDPITPCAAKLEDAVRDGEPEQRIREAVDSLIEMCNRTRAGAPR